MILLIWLAVLAAAAGQPPPALLCNPQCNFNPFHAVPSLSICVSAEADQIHDYLTGTSKFFFFLGERN